MLELKSNAEIGKYLTKLIKKKGYKSHRAFCKEYLEREKMNADDGELKKLENRISQITNGNKGLQLKDLPIMSELLEVTYEEILSAGENIVPRSRPTNYAIASSKEEKEWETFVKRKDKLILNPDEYGKGAIDYAIELKNYEFIKYLLREGYIWFDSNNASDYGITFGAGTRIKRRDLLKIDDYLNNKLVSGDQLRIDIMMLAVANNDCEMLDELRAREIPELYLYASWIAPRPMDIDSRYNEKLVRSIALATDDVVDYFTKPFEIPDKIKYKDGSRRNHIFMFPYISQLLEFLIEQKHPHAQTAIEKCMAYNQNTYGRIKNLIDHTIDMCNRVNGIDNLGEGERAPWVVEKVLQDYVFYEDGNIVTFKNMFVTEGIITNVVRITKTFSDKKLASSIDRLNKSYENIVSIKREYEC